MRHEHDQAWPLARGDRASDKKTHRNCCALDPALPNDSVKPAFCACCAASLSTVAEPCLKAMVGIWCVRVRTRSKQGVER